jgi:hypothetical protein
MKMKLEKKMPISINDQVAHPNLMWPTPTQDSATERTKKYSQGGKPLTLAVKEQMWPTPQARDWKGSSGRSYKGQERDLPTAAKQSIGMWPTPTVNDSKNNAGPSQFRRKGTNLNVAVAKRGADGGKLNPTWVEWLMGYEGGYTDLKDWEILSSRKSSKKSAKR